MPVCLSREKAAVNPNEPGARRVFAAHSLPKRVQYPASRANIINNPTIETAQTTVRAILTPPR